MYAPSALLRRDEAFFNYYVHTFVRSTILDSFGGVTKSKKRILSCAQLEVKRGDGVNWGTLTLARIFDAIHHRNDWCNAR